MLRRLYALAAEGTDPYENLALEAYLLERVQPGECILYLWQNPVSYTHLTLPTKLEV